MLSISHCVVGIPWQFANDIKNGFGKVVIENKLWFWYNVAIIFVSLVWFYTSLDDSFYNLVLILTTPVQLVIIVYV